MTYNVAAGTKAELMRKGSTKKEAFTTRKELAFSAKETVFNPAKSEDLNIAYFIFERDGFVLIVPRADVVEVRAKGARKPKTEATEPTPAPAPAPVAEPVKPTEAPFIPEPIKEAAHSAMKRLAEVCDGARDRDYAGFSGADVEFGHSLAAAPSLSQKQAVYAIKFVVKYQRQLSPEIVAACRPYLGTRA